MVDPIELKEEVHMALAIRQDAIKHNTSYAKLAAKNSNRPSFEMSCPEQDCEVVYVVFYGPELDEAETRSAVEAAIKRHHPSHVLAIALSEPMPPEIQQP